MRFRGKQIAIDDVQISKEPLRVRTGTRTARPITTYCPALEKMYLPKDLGIEHLYVNYFYRSARVPRWRLVNCRIEKEK